MQLVKHSRILLDVLTWLRNRPARNGTGYGIGIGTGIGAEGRRISFNNSDV